MRKMLLGALFAILATTAWGATVHEVGIVSAPSSVEDGETVNITVQFYYEDTDAGPWDVTSIDLRDQDSLGTYQTIAHGTMTISQTMHWYSKTFYNVDLSQYDDGGDGIELYAFVEVDDNYWGNGSPDDSSPVYQVSVTYNQPPGTPGTISASSITRTSATVSWGSASDPDGDSLTYYVEYKTDYALTWNSAGSTTSRSKGISGLSAGTRYDVRVRAYDGNLYGGWRDQEDVITTLPPNQPPGTPGTISASSITRTSATVSWGSASDPDGDSLTYYVEYKTDYALTWNSAGSTTSRSKGISGLSAGTRYDVRVRAYDGNLYGGWRDQEDVITTLPPNQAPGTPGTISASSITRTSATVSWGSASDPDGDGLTYYVEYKTDYALTWNSAGSTTSRSKGISGLSAGTRYDVRVRAYDGNLYGGWRDQEDVITTLPPAADIQARLNRQDGATPATAANTKFILYTSPAVNNVGQNPHTFTGIVLGSYWVEGYQKNTAFPSDPYEYWGAVQANLTANGQTVQAVINRHTPYCEDFWFEYNGSRVDATDKVPPGSTVTAKATVRNKDTSSRQTYVTTGWRFGSSGSAVGTRQSSTVTIAADSTHTFTVGTVTLASGIEDDVYAYVKTYGMFSNWSLTDSWDWGKKFEATTGSRPTVSNITLRDLDGQSVTALTPGKRYVVTADFTDVDGSNDLTYCVASLVNSADAREIALTYNPASGVMGIGSGGYPQLPMPLQNAYASLTHVEKQTISNGYRIRYIFWLTAEWATSTDGVDVIGRAFDAASHQTDQRLESNLDFVPLSLPAGKWTIIIHGKSAATLLPFGKSPSGWQDAQTEWFRNLSDPREASSEEDECRVAWAWNLASKLHSVSKSGVKIHRLGNRNLFSLESWVDAGSKTAGYSSYNNDANKHNVLIFDWEQASDYVSLDDDNHWRDNWYAYAAADALYALAKKQGFVDQLNTIVGYSRGAIVASEFSRRVVRNGQQDIQVVLLDAEGWGEFENEVEGFPFLYSDISLWGTRLGELFNIVDPDRASTYDVYPGWPVYSKNVMANAVGDGFGPGSFDNAQELEYYRYLEGFGYADSSFSAWADTRSDQYRQAYSNPGKAFCGAEAFNAGNDRTVETWPKYSTIPLAIDSDKLYAGDHNAIEQELSHTFFPHYLTDWCYLASDSRIGKVCVETPQLWKWKDKDGVTQTVSSLSYPSTSPGVPENMRGELFNGELKDGSVAGWTYHGGTMPLDDDPLSDQVYRDGNGNHWLSFFNGLLGLKDEVWHNWLVAPAGASALRIWVDVSPGTFDSGKVGAEWHGEAVSGSLGWITTMLYSDPTPITFGFSGVNDVGRLKLWVDDINTGLLYADDFEFIVNLSAPSIGTLAGNPNPVVQGAGLTLIAGGVFDADGSVDEVHFYRDSNDNGVYDSGTDALFGIAYSGSGGNWQISKSTASLPVGQHHFFAQVKDTDGLWSAAVRTSSAIDVTQPANQLPQISNLSDSPDPVDRGGNVTLTASDVSDPDGTVARVEFYRDVNNNAVYDSGTDTLLATDTSIVGGSSSVTVGTGSIPAGTVRFLAIAYDDQGAASATASCRCSIIQKWNLTYQVLPVAGGSITENPGAGSYANGTQINPTAQAAANYSFDHWEMNGTTKTMPVSLDANATVKAMFTFQGGGVAPVLNSIGNQSVAVGLAFSLTATKLQGDTPITWTLESKPTGMTIVDGVISWPNPTPGGSSHYITVKAENSAGSDRESFTFYVRARPDTISPSVQIVIPSTASTYTSPTNIITISGTATDIVGVVRVKIANNRNVGEYICTGTTSWQYNGISLFQGENHFVVTAYDATGNEASDTIVVTYNHDDRYNDVLFSGALVQEIDFADNIRRGENITVRWKALSYMPLRGRLGTGSQSAGWMLFKNAEYTGSVESPWNLNGRHAMVYSYECEYVAPTNSGDFSVWFNHAQMDGGRYMAAVIPDGVDGRPNLIQSKLITRTILGVGTNANPQSDVSYTDTEHPFESSTESLRRSGGTIIDVNIPAGNWAVGDTIVCEWTVLAYQDVKSKFALVNLDQQQFWLTATGTKIATRNSSWHIGSTYAKEYTFRASITVPDHPGSQQLYFMNAQIGVADSSWMAGNIPAGVDPKPVLYNGMYGRFIEREIVSP